MNTKVQFKPTVRNKATRKKQAALIFKNAISIGNKLLAWVPVELMNIAPYQRERQKTIIELAEMWSDPNCNVLLVSYDEENGWFNVVDGQHRATAARMRGIEYLVCEIFTGLSISKEALLFVGQNEHTKKLNPFDTYKANQYITGEDETELSKIDKQIAKTCAEMGVLVEKGAKSNSIKSVTEVRRMIKRDNGTDGLLFTINVIQKSQWDKFSKGFNGDLMDAIGRIYTNREMDTEEIKKRLCAYMINSSPDKLNADANNTYPALKRRARLDAFLADIVNNPVKEKTVQFAQEKEPSRGKMII